MPSIIEKHQPLNVHLLEERENRLSKLDYNHVEAIWSFIKALLWLLVFAAWLLSIWKLYVVLVPVVKGSASIRNINLYFASSFRIFVHTLLATITIFFVGYTGYKLWKFNLFHLDEIIYDHVISPLGTRLSTTEETILLKLENIEKRLMRLEKILLERKKGETP
ncbi:MAG TPA: hypothetical protein ENG14_02185 [Thermodesulforhabdus norvegica]|uniref:Poly-beta-1,6-N-acetyl-D-glucosamine biosynthesis protein PgaD n=1 Tax=Thermodesulforhabdus norvegica TaxID=39841 RepID=A0A7C0WRM6_9BACT|nr:hypothetical protein [Deltaproteobacteria bacterium]MBW2067823.1 hypothetical protein [Deltaproteobacteria bacterium]HDL89694.1 hypothetical protein [Thermodesulforhabdus norvegica]